MIWNERPYRIPGLTTTKSLPLQKGAAVADGHGRAVFEPISRMFCRDKEPLSPARYSCSRCHVCVQCSPRPRGGFGIQIWSITSLLAASAVSERMTLAASRALHRRKKKKCCSALCRTRSKRYHVLRYLIGLDHF